MRKIIFGFALLVGLYLCLGSLALAVEGYPAGSQGTWLSPNKGSDTAIDYKIDDDGHIHAESRKMTDAEKNARDDKVDRQREADRQAAKERKDRLNKIGDKSVPDGGGGIETYDPETGKIDRYIIWDDAGKVVHKNFTGDISVTGEGVETDTGDAVGHGGDACH